eukprot:SAG11_NODE_6496_length_1302_cov_0.986700_2_plen_224_part_00
MGGLAWLPALAGRDSDCQHPTALIDMPTKKELTALLRQLKIHLSDGEVKLLAREVDQDLLRRLESEEASFRAQRRQRAKSPQRVDARKSKSWGKVSALVQAKSRLETKLHNRVEHSLQTPVGSPRGGVIEMCTHRNSRQQKAMFCPGGKLPPPQTTEARDLLLVQRAIGRNRKEQQQVSPLPTLFERRVLFACYLAILRPDLVLTKLALSYCRSHGSCCIHVA